MPRARTTTNDLDSAGRSTMVLAHDLVPAIRAGGRGGGGSEHGRGALVEKQERG